MSLLHDIKKQDRGTREMMFALAMITSVSLVGMVWFRSFQKDMYALLNGEQQAEERFYAGTEPKSLFSYVKETFEDGRALIGNIFSRDSNSNGKEINIENGDESEQNEINPLPVSEDR